MKTKSGYKIIISLVFVIFFISSLSQFLLSNNSSNSYIETIPFEGLQTSRTTTHSNVLWVENPTFEEPVDPWFPSIEGDVSDAITSTSPNQANFQIIGESYEKQVFLSDTIFSNWEAFNKSDLVIVPNVRYGINETGAYCSHDWNEDSGGQPYNTPRMHWKTIVNIPVDMSDYIITSASFQAIINATVNQNIDTPDDEWARWIPLRLLDQHVIYDHAQFYVEISDLEVNELNTYRIAFNQTRLLGNESLLFYEMEGLISTKSEQAIIDALNNVLAIDSGHNNFTVVLGIYMYCEDNHGGNDRDQWEDLRFKSLNLTFNYEKKIDQFTEVSWNQDLNAINGSNVQITDANLKFNFKINQNWTKSSQNSKIRIFINDRKYEQTISLIDYIYSTSFQEANTDGYDIVSKLLPYENFTLTIQVFLAEDFGLEDDIIISITDVYLYISYTETFPDPPSIISEPWFFSALLAIVSVATVCLGGYFIAYQRVLKYPKPVRKVRKFKRTLHKSRAPDVPIMPREIAFKKSYNKTLGSEGKFLKLRPGMTKVSKVIEKFKKKPVPIGETRIDSDQLIITSLEKKEELDKLVEKLPEKPDS